MQAPDRVRNRTGQIVPPEPELKEGPQASDFGWYRAFELVRIQPELLKMRELAQRCWYGAIQRVACELEVGQARELSHRIRDRATDRVAFQIQEIELFHSDERLEASAQPIVPEVKANHFGEQCETGGQRARETLVGQLKLVKLRQVSNL